MKKMNDFINEKKNNYYIIPLTMKIKDKIPKLKKKIKNVERNFMMSSEEKIKKLIIITISVSKF